MIEKIISNFLSCIYWLTWFVYIYIYFSTLGMDFRGYFMGITSRSSGSPVSSDYAV